MPSNLSKFLSGFADEEGQTKKVETPSEKITEVPEPSQQLIRPVERIKRKTQQVQEAQQTVAANADSVSNGPRLKLKLGSPKQVESNAVSEEPVRKTGVKSDAIKTVVESSDIEELFVKSGTSMSFHDQWVATLKKARAANVNTMFNKKVSTGKFRFNDMGELEVLPDLETYGKTSNEIIRSNWNMSNPV